MFGACITAGTLILQATISQTLLQSKRGGSRKRSANAARRGFQARGHPPPLLFSFPLPTTVTHVSIQLSSCIKVMSCGYVNLGQLTDAAGGFQASWGFSKSSTNMNTTPTSYLPLDPDKEEIRLLVLPPKSSTFADYEFVHVSLLSDVPYEALSYAWGSNSPSNTITISGHPFSIRSNLRAALSEISLRGRKRLIWVDALCTSSDFLP